METKIAELIKRRGEIKNELGSDSKEYKQIKSLINYYKNIETRKKYLIENKEKIKIEKRNRYNKRSKKYQEIERMRRIVGKYNIRKKFRDKLDKYKKNK